MPESPRPISTTAQLDEVVSGSSVRPVVIFKHSPTCGISAMAFESIRELLASEPTPADWFVISVRTDRDVATHASKRAGIRHESPQALIFFAGKLMWHGSHFRATSTAILQALERIPANQAPVA
jgi:bacillithiol system protein YtxJ